MGYLKGYEVYCELGTTSSTLPIKGLETAGVSNAPEFEEILVKADEGKPQKSLSGGKMTISLGGKIAKKETAEESTHVDYNDIEGYSRAGTTVYFEYGDSTDNLTGTGIITAYSEDTGSKDVGSWSATLEVLFDDIT